MIKINSSDGLLVHSWLTGLALSKRSTRPTIVLGGDQAVLEGTLACDLPVKSPILGLKRTGTFGALTAALLLAGCAASQQAREVRESGFLGNHYALLRPGEEGEALLVYRNPEARWSSYDKIKLDPVTIRTGEGSEFEDFPSLSGRSLPTLFTRW